MKSLFRVLGILCLLIAIVFFLHGSMKTAEAQKDEAGKYELEEGIIMVDEKESEKFANVSFNIAGGSAVFGVILLLVSRRGR